MSFPTPEWDISVLRSIESVRVLGGSLFFINLSELAGPVSSAGLSAIVGLILLVRQRFAACAGFLFTAVGANLAWVVLKQIVERPRPPRGYAAYLESGFSFPSGHATNAFALGTFIAIFLYHHVPAGWSRRLAVVLPLMLAALIAFGRIYLGVHYLSDVLAGAVLGTAFGYAGTLVWKRLETRNQ